MGLSILLSGTKAFSFTELANIGIRIEITGRITSKEGRRKAFFANRKAELRSHPHFALKEGNICPLFGGVKLKSLSQITPIWTQKPICENKGLYPDKKYEILLL